MKKKLTIFIIVFSLISVNLFPIKIDLKTKNINKVFLAPFKAGAIYFLQKKGIKIVELGEDFSVWIRYLDKHFEDGAFFYALEVRLSYPTAFLEKSVIKSKIIEFNISSEDEKIEYDRDFLKFLKKRLVILTERKKTEAYLGGKKIADTIEELLKDYQKDKNKKGGEK